MTDYSEIIKQYERPEYFVNISDEGVNQLRADWFEGYLKLKPGDRILELGAGRFTLTMIWLRKGMEAVGIDWSMYGCAHYPEASVCAMVQHLPFRDKEFRLVTAFDVFEHLPPEDIEYTIKDTARVCSEYLICNIPLESPDPNDHHHLSKGDRKFWEDHLASRFRPVDYNPANTPGFNDNSTIFVERVA